jgi:hypothetical protein
MSALPEAVRPVVAQPAREVSPLFFFDNINAFQKSAALIAAIELDIFTTLLQAHSSREQTAEALAAKIGASEKGIRILCDFLALNGMLLKHHSASPLAWYEPTPDAAAFLDRRSPSALVHAPKFLAPPPLLAIADVLAASVRKGGTVTEQVTNENDPRWVDFARGIAPLTAASAAPIAELVRQEGPQKILDIAASHGLFGIACLKANPGAQVVAVDGEAVLEVGAENAQKAGVADRWRKLPGDAFAVEFDGGYDVALITNFLHHFEPEVNETFLRKIHASLNDGGKIVLLEFVPNDDRISPPIPASFALIMLTQTAQGDAYTYRQLCAMLENAGFRHVERHDPPTPQTIITAMK